MLYTPAFGGGRDRTFISQNLAKVVSTHLAQGYNLYPRASYFYTHWGNFGIFVTGSPCNLFDSDDSVTHNQ